MTSPGSPGGRVVMAADEVERMMLAGRDVDRYETQVIPDLRERVRDLTVALSALIEAADGLRGDGLERAVAVSRRVLADGGTPLAGAPKDIS